MDPPSWCHFEAFFLNTPAAAGGFAARENGAPARGDCPSWTPGDARPRSRASGTGAIVGAGRGRNKQTQRMILVRCVCCCLLRGRSIAELHPERDALGPVV